MRVLVCGGAGYIGSNMASVLTSAGYEPVVYDNLSTGHHLAVKDAEFVKGDLNDYQLLLKTLRDYRIQAVFHFAAFIEVGESVQLPLKYYRNNLSNTQNLLWAMEQADVQIFIFSSSAAVYGILEKTPINENAPKRPINPYGSTKLAVEQMCYYQSQTGRLRYAALRYFNAAGAGSDATLGEDHRPESHLIPLTIAAAMGKRRDIQIFGTDYPTPDGTCIRDYIHVDDLCTAHLLALEKLAGSNKNKSSELIYNLGNGKGYSVKEVIETVRQISGKDFQVLPVQRRPGDPPVLTSDASKAKTELGWDIKFPKLEQIVESAWQWHNQHPKGYED
ncbi:MAG: UDP-glucose 4-epimerase GalE [Sedimentisphaerales bacterium]|nr:UDP-glucose 4-epimerase GalE [Sedimentisphaerales bacterium]